MLYRGKYELVVNGGFFRHLKDETKIDEALAAVKSIVEKQLG